MIDLEFQGRKIRDVGHFKSLSSVSIVQNQSYIGEQIVE